MTQETSDKLTSVMDLKNTKFPELPLYIISALIFLDIGILLGALNTLGFHGEESGIKWIDDLASQHEIHQTHWTSTLLGGVSILMLGLIYFFFAQSSEKKNPLHFLTILVLILWLAGVAGSYLFAWDKSIDFVDFKNDPKYIIWAVQAAISLFLIIIVNFFSDPEFRKNVTKHPPLYHMLSACIWLGLAIFWRFDLEGGSLDRIFLTIYIFGFFSLTLFGTLSFVLPIISTNQPKGSMSVYRNLILLNSAAVFFVWDDYRTRELDKDSLALDLLGPLLWGLAGFLFIMYVFDLVYKSGVSTALIGMLVALMMFGFFVFDSLMKNLFPQWVWQNHFHFMFIGTLLITIMAIGSRLLIMQYDPENTTKELSDELRTPISRNTTIGMGVTIFGVFGVLGSFMLEKFVWAFWSGIILFTGLLIVELTVIYQMRSKT